VFEFGFVSDGDFYVVTEVTWMAWDIPQGGYLMQRVTLAGGETKKVVLTP